MPDGMDPNINYDLSTRAGPTSWTVLGYLKGIYNRLAVGNIVSPPEDAVPLTVSSVVGTGASIALVGASATRKVVNVFSTATNDPAAVRVDGGTAALDVGRPVLPGSGFSITGVPAQSAMTIIGTTGNKFTVEVG